MEEAVTRKFVHEDSSHIIALCGKWHTEELTLHSLTFLIEIFILLTGVNTGISVLGKRGAQAHATSLYICYIHVYITNKKVTFKNGIIQNQYQAKTARDLLGGINRLKVCIQG